MKKKELGFMFTVVVFVALITIKLWIKQRFELQLLGLIVLIGISWGLKFLVFKKVKGDKKKPDELAGKEDGTAESAVNDTTAETKATPEKTENSTPADHSETPEKPSN